MHLTGTLTGSEFYLFIKLCTQIDVRLCCTKLAHFYGKCLPAF
jgi:hypothetical protein